MTNVRTLTSKDLGSLFQNAIGFNRMFDELLNISTGAEVNYPPYNIIKETDEKYQVEVAVAGFKQDEITITLHENRLSISGKKEEKQTEESVNYVRKGIGFRTFERVIPVGDHVEATGASLEDGILRVTLELLVPEQLQPKSVPIEVKR